MLALARDDVESFPAHTTVRNEALPAYEIAGAISGAVMNRSARSPLWMRKTKLPSNLRPGIKCVPYCCDRCATD